MKKIVIIMICFFLMKSNYTKAQVTDTLAYLQQIVANKSNYVGKSLSNLENTLLIKIKKFTKKQIDCIKSVSFIFIYIQISLFVKYQNLYA